MSKMNYVLCLNWLHFSDKFTIISRKTFIVKRKTTKLSTEYWSFHLSGENAKYTKSFAVILNWFYLQHNKFKSKKKKYKNVFPPRPPLVALFKHCVQWKLATFWDNLSIWLFLRSFVKFQFADFFHNILSFMYNYF